MSCQNPEVPAVRHPVFARLYRRLAASAEDRGLGDLRAELLDGLVGTVVEVGAGDGANFRHYPASVTEVLAVEPEPYLRERATKAAGRASVPVTVVDGLADRLPRADASADAVVLCLVLCSVPAQDTALAEARRVLRPGGELRFLEHVLDHQPGRLQRVQRGVDRFVWPRLFGGCHTARDTVGAITAAGFRVEDLDRSYFPEGPHTPVSPHVRGRARRP